MRHKKRSQMRLLIARYVVLLLGTAAALLASAVVRAQDAVPLSAYRGAAVPPVAVFKFADADTVRTGDTLNYTIYVVSACIDTLLNIPVTDKLPAGTSYLEGSANRGGVYDTATHTVSWLLERLHPRQTIPFTYSVVITAGANGDTTVITNLACITADGFDLCDSVRTVVLPDEAGPSPTISLAVDSAAAHHGSPLVYTITVTGDSVRSLDSVRVVMPIPIFTTLDPGTITGGGVFNDDSNWVEWLLDSLLPGVPVVVGFGVVIDSSASDSAMIIGEAQIASPVVVPSNQVVTDILPRPPLAPTLAIQKSVDRTSASPGDTLAYTISIANNGDTAAFGVLVVDTISDQLEPVISAITPPGVYDSLTRVIQWNLPAVDTSTALFLQFSAIVDLEIAVGTEAVSNVALILSPDTLISDTIVTNILDPDSLDLAISLAVDSSAAHPGSPLVYTITVTGDSASRVDSVLIVMPIPVFTTLVPGTITGGGSFNADSNRVEWLLDSLLPGIPVVFGFGVVIDSSAPDSAMIIGEAQIVSPVVIPSNQVVTDILPRLPLTPTLAIQKSVDRTSAAPGDTLAYTITITNSGDTAAFGVLIADTIRVQLEPIISTITPPGTYDTLSRVIQWNLPVVDTTTPFILQFSVIVDTLIKVGNDSVLSVFNVARVLFPDTLVSDTARTIIPDRDTLDFELALAVDSVVASRQSELVYTIVVKNTGNIDVSNLLVESPIADFSAYVPGSASNSGTFDETRSFVWWLLPAISPGDSLVITYRVTIAPNALDGTILAVTARSTQPLAKNSNGVETLIRVRTISPDDFAVVKSVDNPLAGPNDTLTYTIVVTNVSDSAISGVELTDPVPQGTLYLTGSATGGGVYNLSTRELVWNLGTINPNEADTVSFQVQISGDAIPNETIENQAFVTEPVLSPSNIVQTTISGPGTFLFTKSANLSEMTATDTVLFTINYTNQGTTVRTGVVLTDTLASGFTYIPGSATGGGTYSTTQRTITWNIGTIGAGASGSVQFRARAADGTPNGTLLQNVAFVSGPNLPTDTTEPVIVEFAFPSVQISKTAAPTQAAPGDTVTYTIRVRNSGQGALTGAVVEDDLPSGFSYVSGSARIGNSTPVVSGADPLRVTIGTLNAGDSLILTYRTAIASTLPSDAAYANLAFVSGVTISNDSLRFGPASASVTLGTPRLKIHKRADLPSARVGSLVRFMVTIENLSTVTATDVVLYDEFPPALQYVAGSTYRIDSARHSLSDPISTNPLTWDIGEIGGGERIEIQYSAVVSASAPSGRSTNVAWVGATVGGTPIESPKAGAEVWIVADRYHGSIRGKLVVDCDGDNVADDDSVPVGTRIYLDDGQMSQVNNKGMFYFSTVRAVEHVVALDPHALTGFRLAEGEPSSQFVTVQELGEAYVLFRLCRATPTVRFDKKVGYVPQLTVAKNARINRSAMNDSSGVVIDYDLTVKGAGDAGSAIVRIIDSLPAETRLTLRDETSGASVDGGVLMFTTRLNSDTTFARSVFYSLEDIAPGSRASLTNKAFADVFVGSPADMTVPDFRSGVASVSVGPFGKTPPQDIAIDIIGAQFETSKAELKPEAWQTLQTIADSIKKYADALVRIEGHADIRPIRTREFPSNWELSTARAKVVRDWLARNAGIDTTRMSHEGFAATRPRDPGRSLEAFAKNRRVEVYLKARTDARVDLSQVTDTLWSTTTAVPMTPTSWSDSTFTSPPPGITVGTAPLWEVYLSIENSGPGRADKILITDSVPEGFQIDPAFRTTPARSGSDAVSDRVVQFEIGPLDAHESATVRYRLTRSAGVTTQARVGAASATIVIDGTPVGTVLSK